MSDNDQYKIDKLEKEEVKPLLKEGFSLLFRTPLLTVLSGLFLFGLIYVSYLLNDTSLMYFPLLIIIPFFSYSFCKANDHSLPFWKLDFRYFKFTPLQYIFFIIFLTIISALIAFVGSFFEEDNTTTEEKTEMAKSFIYLIVFLVGLFFSAISSFVFVNCHFTSMLSYHCAEKWQILHLHVKEDINALISFHSLIDDGAQKNRLLLCIIGFLFYFSFYILCFLLFDSLFIFGICFIFVTLFLHHFLYVVIKHICNDGGINDKVKEKTFQFAEGM